MLTLTGTIRAATVLGGGTNRKTGEVIAKRAVLQVEGLDNRGLVQIYTLTVPDLEPYVGKVGQQISVPSGPGQSGLPSTSPTRVPLEPIAS